MPPAALDPPSDFILTFTNQCLLFSADWLDPIPVELDATYCPLWPSSSCVPSHTVWSPANTRCVSLSRGSLRVSLTAHSLDLMSLALRRGPGRAGARKTLDKWTVSMPSAGPSICPAPLHMPSTLVFKTQCPQRPVPRLLQTPPWVDWWARFPACLHCPLLWWSCLYSRLIHSRSSLARSPHLWSPFQAWWDCQVFPARPPCPYFFYICICLSFCRESLLHSTALSRNLLFSHPYPPLI